MIMNTIKNGILKLIARRRLARKGLWLPLHQHAYRSVRYGQWSCGFASRDEWKGKPYWSLSTDYYDGHHWALHIGWFHVGASYY